MPADKYDYGNDDEKPENPGGTKFKEFDCPSCSANNPADPPFGDGAEVLCNYCGTEFAARVSDEGKLKLKEI